MKEYICKEDLIKATEETPFTMSMCLNKDECNGANIARRTFVKIFKAFPAADVVEVKCGKWLLDNGCAYCSACRNNFGKAIMSRANYCPHCGAKMDGGDRGG